LGVGVDERFFEAGAISVVEATSDVDDIGNTNLIRTLESKMAGRSSECLGARIW
jgi:hypothetical protein